MPLVGFQDNVFINCPFDNQYKPLFDALVFAVHDAGFVARSALEISDATENRYDKICAELEIQVEELTFADYFLAVVEWLKKGGA